MSEVQKSELKPESLDVTELEDSELEDAAGGRLLSDTTNNGCPTTNYGC